MDNNWPSYRQKAAARIALHIGRLFRGYLARNRVRWLLYKKYNNAATRIQLCYKKYKSFSTHYLNVIKAIRREEFEKNKVNRVDTVKSLNKIISGENISDDKLILWRTIVDLRRAHPTQSAANCVKAIFQAEGNVQRAKTLLGLPVFSARNYMELPDHIKTMLLPEQDDITAVNEEQTIGIQGIRRLKSKRKMSKDVTNLADMTFHNALYKAIENSYFSKKNFGMKTISTEVRKVYAPTKNDFTTSSKL